MRRPRTPRYWPRMKVRGARRRQDEAWMGALSVAARINARYLARSGTPAKEEDHADE